MCVLAATRRRYRVQDNLGRAGIEVLPYALPDLRLGAPGDERIDQTIATAVFEICLGITRSQLR